MMMKKLLDTLFPNYTNLEFNYWSSISTINNLSILSIENRFLQISKLKSKHKKHLMLDEYLSILMSELIKNSGCNFIIRNLPETHQNGVEVTTEIVHETFVTSAPIISIHKFHNIAYIWFAKDEDAEELYNLINNMQCEDKILECVYTKSDSTIAT